MFRTVRIGPKAFQVIKYPLLMLKNMHHHIHKVHQRPCVAALHMVGPLSAIPGRTLLYVLGYRINLYVRSRFAHHKIIGYRFFYILQVQGYDLIPFFFLYGVNNAVE